VLNIEDTFAFSSDQAITWARQAAAAIGGGILVGAFVIRVPLAGVFYLISRNIQLSKNN
jgi:hypothetical protein